MEKSNFICDGLSTISIECKTVVFKLDIWSLIVAIAVVSTIMLISYMAFRYNDLSRKKMLRGLTAPHKAHTDKNKLKLHPNTLKELLDLKDKTNETPTVLAAWFNKKYAKAYFVAEFKERGKTIARREVRLEALWQHTREGEVRVDPETMVALKVGSASTRDDDTDMSHGVDAVFDIFVHRVRWWYLRHWFFHPERETRLAVRVTAFLTTIEVLPNVLEWLNALA